MSGRGIMLVLGTAASAFLAAGLIPLAISPVAHADDGDAITIANPPAPDSDFISTTDPILKLFGLTDLEAADPDEHFDAMVLSGPGFTDVLTSGIDPSDHLATLLPAGVTLPPDVTAGTVDVTVNTFISSTDPALDSTFTIPFTDPLTELWIFLVQNAFFGL